MLDAARFERRVQSNIEQGSVHQTGERIVECGVREFFFRLLAAGVSTSSARLPKRRGFSVTRVPFLTQA